jgi:hypothetical protein
MARQDDIEELLRRIAPLFLEIAKYAQQASAEFGATEWTRRYLLRTAALNQVAGTARWRIVGDGIVSRQAELPASVQLSTSDGEQNQGRYYLRAPHVAVVLTIRRKPHPVDEQPTFLQLQLDIVQELAPFDFGDEIVIYLAVPRLGHQPRFDLAVRGKQTISYRLIDLVADSDHGVPPDGDGGIPPVVANLPSGPRGGPVVSSALDEDRKEEDNDREEDSAEPPG